MDTAKLYKLASWLSPAFPVGAYSYSHGLEFAVESGLVRDRASLAEWIGLIMLRGSFRVDAVLFREAWEASQDPESRRMRTIAATALAFRGSRETALESSAQGLAFLAAVQEAWGIDLSDTIDPEDPSVAYSVVLGAACGKERIPLQLSLQLFLQACLANLVSAGVRLIPLGQTDGQRIIAQHERTVQNAVAQALKTPLEEVGTSTPMVDWTSMRHETQTTRLFRS